MNQGLKVYPDDVSLINLKALAYFNNNEYQKALPLFERLVALGEIQEFIATEREAKDEKEVPYMTTSIKADETVKMGIITDVKQELRKANALKINYSTRKGVY